MRLLSHLPMVGLLLALAGLGVGCGTRSKIAAKDAKPTNDDSVATDLRIEDVDRIADAAALRDRELPRLADTADASIEAPGENPAPDLVGLDERASKDALPDDKPDDAPVPDVGTDLSPLLAFCTGDSPRLVVNGAPATPSVRGEMVAMDCCDSARFVVTSSDFNQPIGVSWQMETRASTKPPITIDLANPSSDWSVNVAIGCNVLYPMGFCGMDYYNTGLVGSLTVARADGGMGVDMSLCLHVEEIPDKTRYYAHSLDLYVPSISAN
jgi:hypothetical protein